MPIPEFEVRSGVPLDDADGVDLLLSPLESPTRQITTTIRLEVHDQVCGEEMGDGRVNEGAHEVGRKEKQ